MDCFIQKISQKSKELRKKIYTRRYIKREMSIFFIKHLRYRIVCNFFVKLGLVSKKCFVLDNEIFKTLYNKSLMITIDAKDLEYVLKDWVEADDEVLNTSHFFLGYGDWSGILTKIQGSSIYSEALDLQKHNWDYKSSMYYTKYIKRFTANEPIRRQHNHLDTTQKLNQYYERFCTLYHSIQEEGFLPQEQLPKDTKNKNIAIAIDKDWNIVKLAGAQHRVAIAKILNLTSIPVEVKMIHKELIKEVSADYGLDYYDSISTIIDTIKSKYEVCK